MAPGRVGALDALPAYLEIHALVEEAQQALDLVSVGQRVLVRPDQVLLVADRVVARPPLVRTQRHGLRRLYRREYVLPWQVPARWQVRLEQRHGTITLGQEHAIERDANPAVGPEHVDPVVG